MENAMREPLLKKAINYLAVFIVFSGAFVYPRNIIFEVRGAYLIMGLILLFWLPIMKDIVFNKLFFIPFFFLVIFSVFNVFMGLDNVKLLTKQALGISINAIWFYMLIKINDYNINKLFRIYLNIAFVVAIIGLIQEASYLLQFRAGYDYSALLPFWTFYPTQNFLRVNSIITEPAGFCVSMLPSLFVSICSLIDKELNMQSIFRSVIIITAFILSFSSTGYLGLIIALFIILMGYKKVRYTVVILAFGAIFLISAFRFSDDFRSRMVDSFNILRSKSTLQNVNLSTYALYSNALVAYDSLKLSPIIGSGLGSHELSYKKFMPEIRRKEGSSLVNVQDAASLLLRLLSDTGILGTGLFFLFLTKFFIKKKNSYSSVSWVINNSIFVFFVIRLLRIGHYFTDGFF
ncbi:MAG: O-antigen ligase family protein, partial [Candidatus Omnitrophica bacterium]|nr:O-antigen ligase family protein [Candidatus Omnitrophota bacterium]